MKIEVRTVWLAMLSMSSTTCFVSVVSFASYLSRASLGWYRQTNVYSRVVRPVFVVRPMPTFPRYVPCALIPSSIPSAFSAVGRHGERPFALSCPALARDLFRHYLFVMDFLVEVDAFNEIPRHDRVFHETRYHARSGLLL